MLSHITALNPSALASQVHDPAKQEFKTTVAEKNNFNAQNDIQDRTTLKRKVSNDQQSVSIELLSEEELSNNILNMGFITDRSRITFSDSQSVSSGEMPNNSCVSIIMQSPVSQLKSSFSAEIGEVSDMDVWSEQGSVSFKKRSFRRKKPQLIQIECESRQSQLTKKKKANRNKISNLKNPEKKDWELQREKTAIRNKRKIATMEDESNSNETVKDLLANMEFMVVPAKKEYWDFSPMSQK